MNLKVKATELREDILTLIHQARTGHTGGDMSVIDILTVLYYKHMNVSPQNIKDSNRDRFVLSKGHSAEALYCTLADRGFFPKEDLKTLRHLGSYLQGHPDMKHIPGVDMSSGSLGQGISAAVGMALSAKLRNES